MKVKKLAILLALAALSTTMMTGCLGGQKETAAAGTALKTTAETTIEGTDSETIATEETMAEENTAEEDKENYDTGGASLDNIKDQDEIGGNELLVVSFGTSYNDNRHLTVGTIEDAIEKTFPDYSVRRGFISQIVIDHTKSRDQVSIDNVEETLDRTVDSEVRNLMIQSAHLVNGLEYMDLVNEVAEYSDAFERVAVGEPLLTTDDDFRAMIKAITEAATEYDDGETVICFVGHGTEAESNQVHPKMQDMLADAGYNSYYMGTVEASPTVEDVLVTVQASGYEKVVLEPLVIVAGDRTNNDMVGDEERSWKKVFEDTGYEVTCLVRGLGEMEAIRQLFVGHAEAAIESLSK